jgi:hypothetical protein
MKTITLNAFEVIGDFLAWYHENINQLGDMTPGSAMALHAVVMKAKAVASKAVIL